MPQRNNDIFSELDQDAELWGVTATGNSELDSILDEDARIWGVPKEGSSGVGRSFEEPLRDVRRPDIPAEAYEHPGKYNLARLAAFLTSLNPLQPAPEHTPLEFIPGLEKLTPTGRSIRGVNPMSYAPTDEKATFGERMRVTGRDPSAKLPFVGSLRSIENTSELLGAWGRYKNGQATEYDTGLLRNAAAYAAQDPTFGGILADIMTDMPAYMAEFGALKPLQKTVSGAVERGITKKIGEKAAQRFALAKGAGFAAGTAAQTLANAPRLGEAFLTERAPSLRYAPQGGTTQEPELVDMSPRRGVGEDMARAFVDQWIETSSEYLGGPITKGISGGLRKIGATKPGGKIRDELLKNAVIRSLAKLNGRPGVKAFRKALNEYGYQGPIAEMLEERAGDAMRGIANRVGLSDREFQMPSKTQLAAELIGFSLPLVGGYAANAPGMMRRNRSIRQFANTLQEAGVIEDAEAMAKAGIQAARAGEDPVEAMGAMAKRADPNWDGKVAEHVQQDPAAMAERMQAAVDAFQDKTFAERQEIIRREKTIGETPMPRVGVEGETVAAQGALKEETVTHGKYETPMKGFAESFIGTIRNKPLRTFARSYLKWISAGKQGAEPARPEKINERNIQVVKEKLDSIYNEGVQDAKRSGTQITPGGQQAQKLVEGTEGPIRVRGATQAGVETGAGEEVGISDKVRAYVNKIRNPNKKAFAEQYLNWIEEGRQGVPPSRPKNLSVMGEQSVRFGIDKILKAGASIQPSAYSATGERVVQQPRQAPDVSLTGQVRTGMDVSGQTTKETVDDVIGQYGLVREETERGIRFRAKETGKTFTVERETPTAIRRALKDHLIENGKKSAANQIRFKAYKRRGPRHYEIPPATVRAEAEEFEANNPKPVSPNVLKVGDQVEIMGENHVVVEKTPGGVRLKNGTDVFIDSDDELWIDEGRIEQGDAIDAAIAEIRGKVKNAAPVELVDNFDTLPERVKQAREKIRQESGVQGKTVTRGVLWNSKIWMVKDQLKNPAMAQEKFIHEQAHWAIKEIYKDSYAELMQSITDQVGRENILKTLPEFYKSLSDIKIADEYLARIAEKMYRKGQLTAKEKSVWQRFIEWLRDVLGIEKDVDVEKIVLEVRDYLFGGLSEKEKTFARHGQGGQVERTQEKPKATPQKRGKKGVVTAVRVVPRTTTEKQPGARREQIVLPELKGQAQMPTGPIKAKGPVRPIEGEKGVGLFKAKPKGEQGSLLEDFGEKIGGARKDYYAEYASKFKEAHDYDLAKEPLSKTFPEPDYDKLIESGIDPLMVGFVRACRDEIPNRPPSTRRGSYKLTRWVDQTKQLRDFAEMVLKGDVSKEKLLKAIDDSPDIKNRVLGRAELYEAVGHEKSLKGITFSQVSFSLYKGEKNVTKWMIEKARKATVFSNMPRELVAEDTKQKALDKFKEVYELLTDEKKTKSIKFGIYQYRSKNKPGVFIGKKLGGETIEVQRFENYAEAAAYLSKHQAELEAKLRKLVEIPYERRTKNRERIGEDYRKGKDVTPDSFSKAFGFRGVEFGNWVNAKERQDNLNRAYDALRDLATLLEIPTRALSLNGELGLAFGSRGHGGKTAPAAHYEPVKIAINLTRKQGAGSLAHEWFHALDNYISRQRGQKMEYVTNRPELLKEDATRQELIDAFNGVMVAISKTGLPKRSVLLDQRRSSPYWTRKIEMAARTFENYVADKLSQKNHTSDYLANFKNWKEWATGALDILVSNESLKGEDLYPYLKDNEIEPVVKAFDNLFETFQTKETENGVAMFSEDELTHRGDLSDLTPEIQAVMRKNDVSYDGRYEGGRYPLYAFTWHGYTGRNKPSVAIRGNELTPESLQKKIDDTERVFEEASGMRFSVEHPSSSADAEGLPSKGEEIGERVGGPEGDHAGSPPRSTPTPQPIRIRIQTAAEAARLKIGEILRVGFKEGPGHKRFGAEPRKQAEWKYGKQGVEAAAKTLGSFANAVEVDKMAFRLKQIDGMDERLGEMERRWDKEFTPEQMQDWQDAHPNRNPDSQEGAIRQAEARTALPESMKSTLSRDTEIVQKAADDVHREVTKLVRELALAKGVTEAEAIKQVAAYADAYFRGIYDLSTPASRKAYERMMNDVRSEIGKEYRSVTKNFLKTKIFKTPADANALYGLKLLHPNPITNLVSELASVARFRVSLWMREELKKYGDAFIVKDPFGRNPREKTVNLATLVRELGGLNRASILAKGELGEREANEIPIPVRRKTGVSLEEMVEKISALRPDIKMTPAELLDGLRNRRTVRKAAPREDVPEGWKRIGNPDDQIWQDYWVAPELADMINNVIEVNQIANQEGLLNTAWKINGLGGRLKMMFSSFHMMNIMRQSYADLGWFQFMNPQKNWANTMMLARTFRELKRAHLGQESEFVDRIMGDVTEKSRYFDYIRNGGTKIGPHEGMQSEIMIQQEMEKWIEKLKNLPVMQSTSGKAVMALAEFPTQTYTRWLFQYMIPTVSYSHFKNEMLKKEAKLGRPLTDAEKQQIIIEGQNLYGEMNETLLGRSGTMTTLLRLIWQFPGYSEGNFRTMYKALFQWGKDSPGDRSRSNIVNSLILAFITAQIGRLFVGTFKKDPPERPEDVRDMWKIDTGIVDDKGRAVMVDMLSYDKDYWNVLGKALLGPREDIVGDALKRFGGIKSPAFQLTEDLIAVMMGKAITDWKGDQIYHFTDPWVHKVISIGRKEFEAIGVPISFSGISRSKTRGFDTMQSILVSLAGVNIDYTEKQRRLFKQRTALGDIRESRIDKMRDLRTVRNPREYAKKFNAIIDRAVKSDLLPAEMKAEFRDQYIDVDYYIGSKIHRLSARDVDDYERKNIYKLLENLGVKRGEFGKYRAYWRLTNKRRAAERRRGGTALASRITNVRVIGG